MEIEIRKSPSFTATTAKLRAQTERKHEAKYRRAIANVAKPIQAEVVAKVPDYMPSGYERIFQKSLKLTTGQRSGGVTIRARAKGVKGHDRGIKRKESGILNVPIWARGPRKRWKWRTQKIEPHFFTEPITERQGRFKRAVVDAMQGIARELSG